MDRALNLFVLAALNDEYREFSTGGFRPAEGLLAKVERRLNTERIETPIHEASTDPGRPGAALDVWAVRLDIPTGGRPGRHFLLAVEHDEVVPGSLLDERVSQNGGIVDIGRFFYRSVPNAASADKFLRVLQSALAEPVAHLPEGASNVEGGGSHRPRKRSRIEPAAERVDESLRQPPEGGFSPCVEPSTPPRGASKEVSSARQVAGAARLLLGLQLLTLALAVAGVLVGSRLMLSLDQLNLRVNELNHRVTDLDRRVNALSDQLISPVAP